MADTNNGQEELLYSYDSFGEKKKPADNNFLWWCSGAHQKLLKQFPSEHSKYSGLGAVLLATFVLATLHRALSIYYVLKGIVSVISDVPLSTTIKNCYQPVFSFRRTSHRNTITLPGHCWYLPL